MELYQRLLPKLDLVLWAVRADVRTYATGLEVYQRILSGNLERCPVVFVVTQVDKIEPYREWDREQRKPGEKQQRNIESRIMDIARRFDVSPNTIVPVSSADAYNLAALVEKVVEVLPNEKKSSFIRETKTENLSQEAVRSSEKGLIDHIKEIAGNAWDYVKENAADFIIETMPQPVKAAVKWVRSLWPW